MIWRALTAALVLTAGASPAWSAEFTWKNTGIGNWGTASNWTGGIPELGDFAIISNGGTAILSTTSGTATGVNLGFSGTGTLDVISGSHKISGNYLGNNGKGYLNISGGEYYTAATEIGSGTNSYGKIEQTGGRYINSARFYVANSGTGVFNLTDGYLSSDQAWIGVKNGSYGVATINSGTWVNTSSMLVGDSGTGTLNINGGHIIGSNFGASIGNGGTGRGTINMQSGTFETGNFDFGRTSNALGTMNLSGGSLSTTTSHIGGVVGSQGNVVITGGTWNSSGNLSVGQQGSGTLVISNGLVSNETGYIAFGNASTGSVVVSGGTWNSRNVLEVGNGGFGSLTISGSGVVIVKSGTGVVNLSKSGDGTLTLGEGISAQSLQVSGVRTTIGVGSDGIINFAHSGSYAFAPNLGGHLQMNFIGSGTTIFVGSNTNTGRINLKAGALELGSAGAILLTASSTISFEGGTLRYSAQNNADLSGKFATTAGQRYRIDTNSRNVTFATALNSTGGSLVKAGSGTLTLTAANTYSGTTSIEAGTLLLSGAGSLFQSSAIAIFEGSALDVSGVLVGNTYALSAQQLLGGGGRVELGGTGKTLSVSGTLAPGLLGAHSATSLEIEGALDLESGSATHLSIFTPGVNDAVAVTDVLSYGGTLTLSLAGLVGTGSHTLFTFGSLDGTHFSEVVIIGSYTGALLREDSEWNGTADGVAFRFDESTGVFSYSPVPEPSAALLLLATGLGFVISRRTRKKL